MSAKIIKTAAFFALFAFLASCITMKVAERYKPGKWEGEGDGYNGKIVVEVETDSSSILDIKVVQEKEYTFNIGDAIEQLRREMLDDDSADVDTISGATATSEGFIKAVNSALKKAALKTSKSKGSTD